MAVMYYMYFLMFMEIFQSFFEKMFLTNRTSKNLISLATNKIQTRQDYNFCFIDI